jgi:hypothetical protein
MRIISYLSIFVTSLFIFLGIAEAKIIDRFVPSEWWICREILGPTEYIQRFGYKECIPWVDIDSFSKFRKGISLFGKIWKNTYSDNQNLYYLFTNDFKWQKIEMNVKKIRKLKNGYLSDWASYFYFHNGYPYPSIVSFWKVSEWQITYLGQDIVGINNRFYQKWRLLEWYSPENIENRWEFTFHESDYTPGGYMVLLKDDLWGLMIHRIDWVDKDTFKRSPKERVNWYYVYEDKWNYYVATLGPYNYYFESVSK